PNPFNPTTSIEFSLEHRSFVNLSVFNILGQPVETLVDKTLDRGVHRVEFDAGSLPSGAYFYRLSHPEGTETRKMMLLK
ncbi:T9SS type A sorting domain-containing protein, partial [candidate division GN15 bacterium]|nr:T9SS type A sorting domain-containing protein [candidate division GN15 bacterium]